MSHKKETLATLIDTYKKTTLVNLNRLKGIIQDYVEVDERSLLLKNIQGTIDQCSDALIENWSNGRKYLRTEFAMEAFGAAYPQKVLTLSISIDAMINIIDDLLDEHSSKKERAPLIEELIRVNSIYNSQKFSESLKHKIADYFNKILSIFFIENAYRDKIEKEADLEKVTVIAANLFDCQSTDIDIFIDIPLSVNGFGHERQIQEISRAFRALNLLKKDIVDLEHDKKQGTWTFVAYAEKEDKLRFYSNKLVEHYLKRSKRIYENYSDPVISNFYKMVKREADEINKINI